VSDHQAPDAETVQRVILDYLRDELLPPDTVVRPEDDLLSGELLDSLSVLRLATFVDEHFSIGMQPSDFLVENFQNVERLSAYVVRMANDGKSNGN